MTDEADSTALLDRKKRIRSGHRASATRLINQATTVMAIDIDQLSLTEQMLESSWRWSGRYCARWWVRAWNTKHWWVYKECSLRWRRLYLQGTAPTSASSAPPDHSVIEPRATPPTANRVKLPKISLPQFRGNPMKWTAFWDLLPSTLMTTTSKMLSEVQETWPRQFQCPNPGGTVSKA